MEVVFKVINTDTFCPIFTSFGRRHLQVKDFVHIRSWKLNSKVQAHNACRLKLSAPQKKRAKEKPLYILGCPPSQDANVANDPRRNPYTPLIRTVEDAEGVAAIAEWSQLPSWQLNLKCGENDAGGGWSWCFRCVFASIPQNGSEI